MRWAALGSPFDFGSSALMASLSPRSGLYVSLPNLSIALLRYFSHYLSLFDDSLLFQKREKL
jgi:hypothetical protein